LIITPPIFDGYHLQRNVSLPSLQSQPLIWLDCGLANLALSTPGA